MYKTLITTGKIEENLKYALNLLNGVFYKERIVLFYILKVTVTMGDQLLLLENSHKEWKTIKST